MRAEVECDLLVVGGGLAGAALARAMGRAGARVIVAERERAFRERIRGEVLYPWGVAEARALGLVENGPPSWAREAPMLEAAVGGETDGAQDARRVGPHRLPSLVFRHPRMQEALLDEAGGVADVWRGATIAELELGPRPTAVVAVDGRRMAVRSRLVVGADGRESTVARLAGLERVRDAEHLITSGMLVRCSGLPEDTVYAHLDPRGGRMAILLAPEEGLQRVYLIYDRQTIARRLSGERDFPEALRHLGEVGVPDEHLAGARLYGPYASFDGAHRWIASPAAEGLALVGDAAAASDPAWGCGLSRTLRDVRLLRDALLADDDWLRAARVYAGLHDDAFARLRAVERAHAEVMMATGPAADAARERAWPALASDPESSIELSGPEQRLDLLLGSLDEPARARALAPLAPA